MFENRNRKIIDFGKKKAEKRDAEIVDLTNDVRARIKDLEWGVGKYEEWKKAALAEGDESSAEDYDEEILKLKGMILEGEDICATGDMESCNRAMRRIGKELITECHERIKEIDAEAEALSACLELLVSETESKSDVGKSERIEDMRGRLAALECERNDCLKMAEIAGE